MARVTRSKKGRAKAVVVEDPTSEEESSSEEELAAPVAMSESESEDDMGVAATDDLLGSDDETSDEEDTAPRAVFDSDSESDGEELPIERKARELDQRAEKEAEDDLDELRQRAAEDAVTQATEEGDEDEDLGPIDLQKVKDRIHDTARLLEDFKNLVKEKGAGAKSRAEYRERLIADLAAFYGYIPYLTEMFLDMFSPAQAIEFLEANEAERPVTIRTNTLKTRRKELMAALQGRGMRLESMDQWSKVGMVVYHSSVPVGATPEYLAGHYMIQSASSFLPCISLGPLPGERVLDLCAAPGGKTSYMAAQMKNSGVIFANDKRRDRLRATTANVHRMGVRNVVVTSYDGRQFPKVMRGFDRCLLDAPCTGLGVISKDPSVKMQRDEKEILALAHLQRELLVAAVDCVDADSKTGGVIVYSTCSCSVEENEAVVDYILKNRNVKLESTNLPFGVPGFVRWKQHRFHPSVALTRRFYPHTHNMDGFYVARFRKTSNAVKEGQVESNYGKNKKKKKPVDNEEEEEEEQDEEQEEQEQDEDEDEDEDEDGGEEDEKPKKQPPASQGLPKLTPAEKKAARKAKRAAVKAAKLEAKKKRTMDVVEAEEDEEGVEETTGRKKKKLKAAAATSEKKKKASKKPAAAAAVADDEDEPVKAVKKKTVVAAGGKASKAKKSTASRLKKKTPSKKKRKALAVEED